MNRKYTNSDVHNDERLFHLAMSYLETYKGSFHVVLGAKAAVESGAKLTVFNVRMILNCMLADTNVINMPTPVHAPFDATRYMIVDSDGTVRLGHSHGSFTPNRPAVIHLKSKWNKVLGTSKMKRSFLIHHVDTSLGAVVYMPLATAIPKYQMKIHWICGAKLAKSQIQLLGMDEAEVLIENQTRAWCKRCFSVTREEESHAQDNRTPILA